MEVFAECVPGARMVKAFNHLPAKLLAEDPPRDHLLDQLTEVGTAYVPFFPLGGFSPLQSATLSEVAAELGATAMQVALAWLLLRAPNVLLIPGTSSAIHLKENNAAANLRLPPQVVERLNSIAVISR
jgi:pyridoxine 4-dehydrogenase